MKTEKKIKTVEITYWTCAKPEHCHQTADVAQKCIDKTVLSPKETNVWTRQNRRKILADRRSGMSYAEIGRKWKGITGTQAKSVIVRSERMEKNGSL
jgi:hypothetical protein